MYEFIISRELASLKHRLSLVQAEADEQKRIAAALQKVTEDQKTQLHSFVSKQLQQGEESSVSLLEELQQANDALLRQVADLQVRVEEAPAIQESPSTVKEVATLKEELQAVRTSLQEQERMTDTITKQCDMYRTLLAEKDAALLNREEPESALHTTHTYLLQQATEAKRALQTANRDHQQEVDGLRRRLAQTEADLQKANRAVESERACVRQAHEAVERQQAVVATLEEKASQMEAEAAQLQNTLASKQVEVNQEREKVCFS